MKPSPSEPFDIMERSCPTREVLGRIGDKWTMLVVLALDEGPLRFSQLKRRIVGVAQKMLTQTLRGLERDGMVSRKIFPTVPITVEYSLTPLGRSLGEAVAVMRGWTYQHLGEIEAARQRFDERKAPITAFDDIIG